MDPAQDRPPTGPDPHDGYGPPPLRWVVEQVDTRLLVRLSGELSTASAPRVRAVLVKALADHPDAVVVDLAGLVVRQSAAVTVFKAAARQAARWPGIPLLLCTADPPTTKLLRALRLPVFPTAQQALATAPQPRLTMLADTLLPVPSAAHHARELAAEACTRWRLPHLIGFAGLIASELVANAVEHARTLVDIRFTVGHRYLMISVRDGSTDVPSPSWAPLSDAETGRGMLLVDATAHRWGSLPVEGGKVVWATLRTRPVPDDRPNGGPA
ncbi:STAS domain-containing protein [Krasilnikovia cinnamomea]|nr:STAS domain-containing protein [Krasilnikovia cinnamomea]